MAAKINNVFNMMRRALNTLDYQLMDHGERVTFLLLNMYENDGTYTNEQLVKICYLGMFHDIGAYQTEMLDSLVKSSDAFHFEVKNTLLHSVYGYLFLKRQPFFDEFSESILFHHFPYSSLLKSDCKDKQLAARMFLADKIDFLILKGYARKTQDITRFLDNPVFAKEEVQNLLALEEKKGIITSIINGHYLEKVLGFLHSFPIHENHLQSLLMMLPSAIDFRSEHTVTHTAATVEIAVTLAKLMHLNEDETQSLQLGALFHDIGKIAVSPMILEKTTALTPNEFKVMKDHVLLSEHILQGCVNEEILHIAVRHHEKLDGNGYPKGLKDEDLTFPERILAIADILSALMGKRSYKEPFPKEKVVSILQKMANDGQICKRVVVVALDNYDLIEKNNDTICQEVQARYDIFKKNAQELYTKYSLGVESYGI